MYSCICLHGYVHTNGRVIDVTRVRTCVCACARFLRVYSSRVRVDKTKVRMISLLNRVKLKCFSRAAKTSKASLQFDGVSWDIKTHDDIISGKNVIITVIIVIIYSSVTNPLLDEGCPFDHTSPSGSPRLLIKRVVLNKSVTYLSNISKVHAKKKLSRVIISLLKRAIVCVGTQSTSELKIIGRVAVLLCSINNLNVIFFDSDVKKFAR